jgi:hypothetical protein
MAKEKKTSEELKALLDESIKWDETSREGAQWIKIIPVKPPVGVIGQSGIAGNRAASHRRLIERRPNSRDFMILLD